VKAYPDTAFALSLDVTDHGQVVDVVRRAGARFGGLDVLEAVEFLRAHRNARATHISETLTVDRPGPDGVLRKVVLLVNIEAFASLGWREVLRDKAHPGLLARRHLEEVCVFSALAAELRSGEIAVLGSDSFANLHWSRTSLCRRRQPWPIDLVHRPLSASAPHEARWRSGQSDDHSKSLLATKPPVSVDADLRSGGTSPRDSDPEPAG
jgi:hypothetical protein